MKHPKEEVTFLIIKPDGVRRGLIGETIRRMEQRGLKIIALSMESPSKKKVDGHYPKDKKWIHRLGEKTLATYEKYGVDPIKEMGTKNPDKIGREVRKWLMRYLSPGPVVKCIVKGVHAVEMVRKLTGDTMPSKAQMGTIRGDYSVDSPMAANKDKRAVHNIVHASETPAEARHEIKYWFSTKEIHDYRRTEEDLMI